ncbi:MAG TPA: sulfur transferase domain-containing protein [Oscillatoriaceae cyanobacterium]
MGVSDIVTSRCAGFFQKLVGHSDAVAQTAESALGRDTLSLSAKSPTLENFRQVTPNLLRGGVPDEADLAWLAAHGVKTDVSLQNAFMGSEKPVVAAERQTAAKLGMNFVNLPLPYGKEPPQSMVDSWVKLLEDPNAGPIYVHCKQGRDRTGTMVAIERILNEGYTGEQALAEMKTFGFDPSHYPKYAEFVLALGKRVRQASA